MTIYNLKDFHEMLGETIMHCQLIEHDLKLIYAGMLKGDFDRNFDEIENLSLGQVVTKLERLDKSDNKPFFGVDDYKLFKKITKIRNHCAHEIYREFMYKKGCESDEAFVRQAELLEKDYEMLSNVSEPVEDVRLKVLRKYGRI